MRSQRHLVPCCWISGATGAPSARSAGSGWPTGWWPTATTTAAAPPSTPMTSSPSEVGRITLEHVTFRYLEQSKRPVLDEVSASFDRSRITVLTGPSGCGKSTLLYLAAGIYPQNAGFLQGARCGWRDRSPPPWGRGAVRPGGHAVPEPGAPVLYGHGGERAVLLSGEPAGAPGGDGGAAERRPGLLRHRPPAPPPPPLPCPAGRSSGPRWPVWPHCGRPGSCWTSPSPIWTTKPPPFSADSSPGSTGNAAPAFWPSTTGWTTGCPSPTRSASWPRTARWTAPPMPPAPSPLRRGRSGASASPAAPTRPPGRSRPGRRRWCSPCGACGSPRMGARCCGT